MMQQVTPARDLQFRPANAAWENVTAVFGRMEAGVCGHRGHPALLHVEKVRSPGYDTATLLCHSLGAKTVRGVGERLSAALPNHVQLTVAGVRGLHGQHVQQHVEVESKVGSVNATVLNLSMAATSVSERRTMMTAVTPTTVPLMAVYLTLALVEWIVLVPQMDRGSVAHALLVSVEMVPTVKTSMSVTW